MPATPTLRDVLALAVPALGALAAEPLYVLGDTAIVGHLGTTALAGLALGGLLLSEGLGLCTVLEYGATARVARLVGAGDERAALDVGVQATWFSLALGLAAVAAFELLAGPLLGLLAGDRGASWQAALDWVRIAALGSPFVLVVAAGQGWMRGFQDTRTPFYVLGASNAASVLLSLLLVQGVGLGIEGSAIANVAAQVSAGAVFVALLVRRGAPLAPSVARIRRQIGAARDLALRTGAFLVAFTTAAGVAARMGDAALGAHQIGFQLWYLLALALDSLAIAAQALVGRLLGAGEVDAAWHVARRVVVYGSGLGLGCAAVLVAGHAAIPALFSGDGAVRRQAAVLWPWFVVQLPLCGALFALDGVLLGAGDLAFMRNVTVVAAVGGFLPLTVLTAWLDLGLGGLWAGLAAFVAIRLVAGVARWRGRAWLVPGASLVDDRR